MQLQQSQKLEAIGILAGGIAHDFSNIISIMLGFTELSYMESQQGSILRSNLEEIIIAGKRARELIDQILTFGRRSENRKKPVQMNIIVKETLRIQRSHVSVSRIWRMDAVDRRPKMDQRKSR